MLCVKLIVWSIVAQEGTNAIIFYIFEYGAEYGAESSAESSAKYYFIFVVKIFHGLSRRSVVHELKKVFLQLIFISVLSLVFNMI